MAENINCNNETNFGRKMPILHEMVKEKWF